MGETALWEGKKISAMFVGKNMGIEKNRGASTKSAASGKGRRKEKDHDPHRRGKKRKTHNLGGEGPFSSFVRASSHS